MSNRRRVEVSSNGFVHTLLLDGVDLSHGLRGATLEFEAGSLPKLTLDPLIVDVATHADPVAVHIAPAAVDLLLSLGWTAPGSAPQSIPTASEPHGTDDTYPYGGDYDEGREYTIACYCGQQFTGETDGAVEADLDEHVDRLSKHT